MVVALLVAAAGCLHPIHSSLTTIAVEAGKSVAAITIKVYAEDFPPGRDIGKIRGYLENRLVMTDRSGRVLPVELQNDRIDGAVQWIAATVRLPGTGRLVLRNTLMTDRFPDQVNIVQARFGGRVETLLFSGPGEAKELSGR